MIRRLSILSIALVSALTGSNDGAPSPAATNVKLLISPIASKPLEEMTFEDGLREAGWDPAKPHNLQFHTVRTILARQELLRLEEETHLKAAYRARRSVRASA